MKKTIALITAIVMTLAIFVTDVVGITMIVRAEDSYEEEGADYEEEYYEGDDQDDDDQDDEEEERKRAEEEEERRRAEEEEEERRKAEQEEEERRKAEEEEEERRKAEEEEEERKKAEKEEEERKKAEEEEKKKAEKEEKERKKAEEEEKKRAEQEEKERKKAEKEEKERQEALKKAAEEAEEAAKRAQEEKEAKEALKRAEEEEKQRKEAEEAAKRAAKEKKKAEEGSSYSLSATSGSSGVSGIDFGTAQAGEQRNVKSVVISNTGKSAVDLIYTKTGDADGAFSISIGGKTHLEPGESSVFNISMSGALGVGKYKANVKFADATRDPGFSKGLKLSMTGIVSSRKEVIAKISVTPSKISVATGGNAQFAATVNGDKGYTSDVIWTVAGNRSTGTKISGGGLLKVAKDETASSISVIATFKEDTSVQDSAAVSIERNCYNICAYADPAKGGRVTGGGAVPEGGSVTLSAIPAENYVFDGWYIDGKKVSTDTNYKISKIKSNEDVVAEFSQNSVKITAVPNHRDAGDVVGGGRIKYGGSTTLSAKAYDGYVFTGWEEDGDIVSRDASIKLKNLTVDRKFTAVFRKTEHAVNVVAWPSDGGTVTGGGKFKLGDETSIKASPAAGFRFDGWQVNGEYVSRDLEYWIKNVKQDYTFTAIFTRTSGVSFDISSGVATTGGSISPCGKMSIPCGLNITYTITPKAGFAILAVAVDGVQIGPVETYTFSNVQSPHMIAAAFVQTDAGKKAAEASGVAAQSRKVMPLEKTSRTTADEKSVVDLDEAASGEGSDNYVEEMDLSEVDIPTDEELGIAPFEEEEEDDASEVAKLMGKSMNEVTEMISEGDTVPIVKAAFFAGYLGEYVVNALEPSYMNGIDYNRLSREELMIAPYDRINPSLPDFDAVVQKMLSEDDLLKLARGEHVDIAVSLTGQDDIDEVVRRIMQNAVGRKAVKFFDLTMLKTVDGFTERVTELPTTMEVVIEIPDDVYEEGKEYSVLRVHNEELKVLPDLDDDPKTITFRTDRFSNYAIAKEVTSANVIIAWLAVGAGIALVFAVTCFAILVAHQRKMRRMRRRARARAAHAEDIQMDDYML